MKRKIEINKTEPQWSEFELTWDNVNRNMVLSKYFSFCNVEFDRKKSKHFLLNYLKKFDKHSHELLKDIDESDIIHPIGWIARMYTNGFNPDWDYKLKQQFHSMLTNMTKSVKVIPVDSIKPQKSPHERMMEIVSKSIGDIEFEIDQFILNGCRNTNFNLSKYFKLKSIKPRLQKMIRNHFVDILTELTMISNEKEIAEQYSNFTKPQINRFIDFLEVEFKLKPKKQRRNTMTENVYTMDGFEEVVEENTNGENENITMEGAKASVVFNSKYNTFRLFVSNNEGFGTNKKKITNVSEEVSRLHYVTKNRQELIDAIRKTNTLEELIALFDSIKSKRNKINKTISESDEILKVI